MTLDRKSKLPEPQTDYARRLQQAYLASDFKSQTALARAAGINQQNISHMMGKAEWSKDTPKVAQALGVSAEWLATGIGAVTSVQTNNAEYNVSSKLSFTYTRIEGMIRMGKAVNGTIDLIKYEDDNAEAKLLNASDTTRCFEVSGSEFTPTLHDGWLVAVDSSLQPQPGEMLLLHMKKDIYMLVIHLYQRGNSLTCQSITDLQNQTIDTDEVQEFLPVTCIAMPSQRRIRAS